MLKNINYKIQDFSYILPFLPRHTKKIIIHPRYKVNLYYLTCSCKVYRENVKFYPKRDYRRLCSHIVADILKETDFKLDEFTKLLMENHVWFGKEILKSLESKNINQNETVILGLNENRLNVYIKYSETGWGKYTYLSDTSSWGKDFEPVNSRLKTFIENNCNKIINAFSNNEFIPEAKTAKVRHFLSNKIANIILLLFISNYLFDYLPDFSYMPI